MNLILKSFYYGGGGWFGLYIYAYTPKKIR